MNGSLEFSQFMILQPKMNELVKGVFGSHISIGTSAPITIPTPPTRGIGTAWTLRGSGLSTIPRADANRIMTGIIAILIAKDIMAIRRNEPSSLVLMNLF